MLVSSSGLRCHFPTAYVAYPFARRISERKPFSRGGLPQYPGKPIARSATRPMPLRWWFRPVRRQTRVGEHSAVVWKFESRTPSAATPSMTGVSMSDP